MQRVFVKAVGRFRPGDVRDYPKHVWTQLERSVGQPLDRFTRPVEEAVKDERGERARR